MPFLAGIALSQWLQGAEAPDLFDCLVRLDVSVGDLAREARAWMLDLAEFPER
ncbi:MAG TPA: hypothetical protein VIY52_06715 [Streptosporangiaceae bacterium]